MLLNPHLVYDIEANALLPPATFHQTEELTNQISYSTFVQKN